jgi:AmmeMemoRadiSam system protein B
MRPPAVAGSFYPDDPAALQTLVDELLGPGGTADEALAYIVPHAGYRWSGPTAAHVYRRLVRRSFERVVILGPAHRVPLRGAAVPTETHWATPLGPVAIDTEGAKELVARGLAVADDAPHAPEHSIEMQIPFLQGVPNLQVLPVCIGQSEVDDVAAVLRAVAGPGTVVLCSTDLSHYLTEVQARRRDAATAAAIVDLAPERIGVGDACGRHALRGLLAWGRSMHLQASIIRLATSADEGGPKNRVVGYAAAALTA